MEFTTQINQITKNIISLNSLENHYDGNRKESDITEHLIAELNDLPINENYSKL